MKIGETRLLPGDYALDDAQLAEQLAKIGAERDEALKRDGKLRFWPGDEIPVILYRGEVERVIKALRGCF